MSMILILLECIVLTGLILCSAFFSSAEMALFSLNRARISSFSQDPNPVRRRIFHLMQDYHRTLITIILGNMFVNGAISMLNEELLSKIALGPVQTLILSGISSILLLLLFGEITPMTIAYIHCDSWSERVATPIYYFRKLLSPVTFGIGWFCEKVLDLLGRRDSAPLTHEEYLSFLDSCVERGGFAPDEAALMKEAFALRQKTVDEIMIPRIDLVCTTYRSTAEETADRIRKNRQAYLPVSHNDNLDSADAMISSRLFFSLPRAEREDWKRAGLITPASFLPGKCTLTKALHTLREKNDNAALVTDEYGGICGMVTIQDIYSELAGRSVEVGDQSNWNQRRLDRNTWEFDGLCTLEFVRENSPWTTCGNEEDTQTNTLSGYFCEKFGAIPQIGEELHLENDRIVLKALEISRNRITRIQLVFHALSDNLEQGKNEEVSK